MPDDTLLSEQLASRLLELIDIPSESRDEAALAAHVREVLDGRDLGDSCVYAGPENAKVILTGHLDTVPTQGNRPGSRDAERVHGLGASTATTATPRPKPSIVRANSSTVPGS